MTVNTYGDINQRTAAWAVVEMLEHARPVNILSMFGESKPIPRNKAETVKFRRRIPFDPVTTPLQEGVTPTAHAIRFEDVTTSLIQWGEVVVITDKVHDLSEDPVLKEATEEAGENAGRTLERITWGVLKGGTSVFYANGSARAHVNTPISLNKQRAIVRYLKAMKAKKHTKILAPSANIGTRPIEAAYVAVGHTDCESDIRNMTGFVAVAAYGSRQPICEYEVGSVEDVRYILSPDLPSIPNAGSATINGMVSTSGTAVDVYPIIYLGMNAYGLTPLKSSKGTDGKNNMAIVPTVINPDSRDKSDVLGQRGYVGWKAWFNAVRLNETWMSRAEVGVTAL